MPQFLGVALDKAVATAFGQFGADGGAVGLACSVFGRSFGEAGLWWGCHGWRTPKVGHRLLTNG